MIQAVNQPRRAPGGTQGPSSAAASGPFDGFLVRLDDAGFSNWCDALRAASAARLTAVVHGDLPRWQEAVEAMPAPEPGRIRLDRPRVTVVAAAPIDKGARDALNSALDALHPWRKGPFELHGIHVDAEWRSDRKWARISDRIAPLDDRVVLDIGAGNGYYAWRMLGAGARLVLGIDPTLLFVQQFLAVRRLIPDDRLAVLPLGIEHLPEGISGFDTVFSMGVLYHRRSPMDHLLKLRQLLRPGGELVLETLVLEGEGDRVLVPRDRYARMRNVWFIPTVEVLTGWMLRCGLQMPRLIHVGPTTTEEQRATPWMRFESLDACLDEQDPTRTLEGYQAPVRAVLVAKRGEK